MTRVDVDDLLGMKDTAARAGITTSYLRVLLGRDQFPAPVKREPQLWLKRDIDAWKKARR